MDIFSVIAEQKIREAMERGEFDDLPGRGRPQDLEDEARVPEEMRLAYIILKNSGCVPPEVALKQEIIKIEDMLGGITDEREKYLQIKKLNFLVTKLNAMRRAPVNFEEEQRYYPQLVDRVTLGGQTTAAPKPDKPSTKK